MNISEKNQIKCPKCGHNFSVDEFFTKNMNERLNTEVEKALLKEKEKLTKEISKIKDDELKTLQAELADKLSKNQQLESKAVEFQKLQYKHKELEQSFQIKLETKELELQEKITQQVEREMKAKEELIRKTAINNAEKDANHRISVMQMELDSMQEKQKKALAQEIENQRMKMKLADIEIEIQNKLEKAVNEAQQKAKKEQAEIFQKEFEQRLHKEIESKNDDTEKKLREKDARMEGLVRQIDEMKRRSEQGSMQLQGEAQELLIEEFLRASCPNDEVEEVKKGQRGADVILNVFDEFKPAGKIIIESKNAKTYKKEWIDKIKEDTVLVKGDIAILVTNTLPNNIEHAGQIDGVWICDYHSFKFLIFALRETIIKLNQSLLVNTNRAEKTDMLFDYLTSNEFRSQLEGIISGFVSIKTNIAEERYAMERIWKKREVELEKAIMQTNGFYGSIKGIVGAAIPDISLPGSKDLLQLGD